MTELSEINQAKQELMNVENNLEMAKKRLLEMMENEPVSPLSAMVGAVQIIISCVIIYIVMNLSGQGTEGKVIFVFNVLFGAYFIYAGAGKIIKQITVRSRRKQLENEISGMQQKERKLEGIISRS